MFVPVSMSVPDGCPPTCLSCSPPVRHPPRMSRRVCPFRWMDLLRLSSPQEVPPPSGRISESVRSISPQNQTPLPSVLPLYPCSVRSDDSLILSRNYPSGSGKLSSHYYPIFNVRNVIFIDIERTFGQDRGMNSSKLFSANDRSLSRVSVRSLIPSSVVRMDLSLTMSVRR